MPSKVLCVCATLTDHDQNVMVKKELEKSKYIQKRKGQTKIRASDSHSKVTQGAKVAAALRWRYRGSGLCNQLHVRSLGSTFVRATHPLFDLIERGFNHLIQWRVARQVNAGNAERSQVVLGALAPKERIIVPHNDLWCRHLQQDLRDLSEQEQGHAGLAKKRQCDTGNKKKWRAKDKIVRGKC